MTLQALDTITPTAPPGFVLTALGWVMVIIFWIVTAIAATRLAHATIPLGADSPSAAARIARTTLAASIVLAGVVVVWWLMDVPLPIPVTVFAIITAAIAIATAISWRVFYQKAQDQSAASASALVDYRGKRIR